jgi:hypothetical protein
MLHQSPLAPAGARTARAAAPPASVRRYPGVVQCVFIQGMDEKGPIYKWQDQEGKTSDDVYIYLGRSPEIGDTINLYLLKGTENIYKERGGKLVDVTKKLIKRTHSYLISQADMRLTPHVSTGFGGRALEGEGTLYHKADSEVKDTSEQRGYKDIIYKQLSTPEFDKKKDERRPHLVRSNSSVFSPVSTNVNTNVETGLYKKGDRTFFNAPVSPKSSGPITVKQKDNKFRPAPSYSYNDTEPAMSGWNAFTYAVKKGYEDRNTPTNNWEWLHIRGKQLGGDYHPNNLVAGTWNGNSDMISLENEIREFSQLVAKDPVAELTVTFSATVLKQTHVGDTITISWTARNMDDSRNCEELREAKSVLKKDGKKTFQCHRTTPYLKMERLIDTKNLERGSELYFTPPSTPLHQSTTTNQQIVPLPLNLNSPVDTGTPPSSPTRKNSTGTPFGSNTKG